ncbi:MAG: hypothetical protein IJW73_00705 [Candidatus Gastranaerophilales bacterium]|nr:hypothetical protein [Candidatus Gastranaerophilales bacterium]
MKINSINQNFKSTYGDFRKKQDEKIKNSLAELRSRDKCIKEFTLFSSALVSFVAGSKISTALYNNSDTFRKIVAKTNPKMPLMRADTILFVGLMALGIVSGQILAAADKNKNTTFGNFAYKFFNGPKAKIEER